MAPHPTPGSRDPAASAASSSATLPVRPGPAPEQSAAQGQSAGAGSRYRKRKSNRGNKKNRRKSFAVLPSAGSGGGGGGGGVGGGGSHNDVHGNNDDDEDDDDDLLRHGAAGPLDDLVEGARTSPSASRNDYFEGVGTTGRRRPSSASIDSETLLDHRGQQQQPFLRPRRPSVVSPALATTGVFSFGAHPSPTRLRVTKATGLGDSGDDDDSAKSPRHGARDGHGDHDVDDYDGDGGDRASSGDEGAPLLSRGLHSHLPGTPFRTNADVITAYGSFGGIGGSSNNNLNRDARSSPSRRGSVHSSVHQRFLTPFGSGGTTAAAAGSVPPERYNINYPPSVPGSPVLRPSDPLSSRSINFGDEMLRDELSASQRHDHLDAADSDDDEDNDDGNKRRRRASPPSPPLRRSNTAASIRNLGRSSYSNDAGGGPRRRESFGAASGGAGSGAGGTGSGGSGSGSGGGSAGIASLSLLDAAQDDVCFPQETLLSEIAEEDHEARQREEDRDGGWRRGSRGSRGSHGGGRGGRSGRSGGDDDDDDDRRGDDDRRSSRRGRSGGDDGYRVRPGRRRRGKWPDLAILEDWRQLEKEDRSWQGRRAAKKITEPQLINGRLRPVYRGWHRAEEDAPYRFTYFNELFQSTIHSATISELVQPGDGGGESDLTFRDLFIPDPPLLSDSEDDEEEVVADEAVDAEAGAGVEGAEAEGPVAENGHATDGSGGGGGGGGIGSGQRSSGTTSPDRDGLRPSLARLPSVSAVLMERTTTQTSQAATAASAAASPPPRKTKKPPQYGERPVWWLDVLSPTEAEMKVLSKAFGIHPLTAEDILMQEAREKVELFQHYYFVSYRSFDQDPQSATFLEPVNMYVVVFREGVLSFHFSMTPHPAHVRRRIRQLSDYMILSSDWISYAIIDDITDVFVPLIQNIEDEVDDIDDAILAMHVATDGSGGSGGNGNGNPNGKTGDGGDGDGSMLRRVGDCRKRVMSLYRLLGNKADVIKGFAKRCNEYWEVAPRSEIGLYLGDIQDHIVTMTANLSHYEKILSRSHGNYLAQINIRMNERQEQTADVLGKLTVLGTIVLPMNIITGLWGMNVWVPGQDVEGDLGWFAAITAGLLFFGMVCYLIAKRVYNIV